MQWEQLAIVIVFGVFGFGPVLGLILARKRLGTLNTASWLVIWGAVIITIEHAQFAISYSLPFKVIDEGPLTLPPHARVHFFMAGSPGLCSKTEDGLAGMLSCSPSWSAAASICSSAACGFNTVRLFTRYSESNRSTASGGQRSTVTLRPGSLPC